MDTTVDPCEDFYSFSCGGWSKVNIIPDDKARFGAFSQVWIRGSVYPTVLLLHCNTRAT